MAQFDNKNRLDALEKVKRDALAGDYTEALLLLQEILDEHPDDIEALRLKGNILELKCFDYLQDQGLEDSEEFRNAKFCYEKILRLDPNHLGALCDLGCHYKNGGDSDKAIEYFDVVISKYSLGDFSEYKEAFIDVLKEKIEILRERGELALASDIEALLRRNSE